MKTGRFTGRTTKRRRAIFDSLWRDVRRIQKIEGQNTTVQVFPGEGSLIAAQTVGVCCYAVGLCLIKKKSDCIGSGGTYQGVGTCDDDPCPCDGAPQITLVSSCNGLIGGDPYSWTCGPCTQTWTCPAPAPWKCVYDDNGSIVGGGGFACNIGGPGGVCAQILLCWGEDGHWRLFFVGSPFQATIDPPIDLGISPTGTYDFYFDFGPEDGYEDHCHLQFVIS